jgi:hypothetical protein
MKRLFFLSLSTLLTALPLFAGEAVETAPTAPYARFIMVETLALFWVGIIGLVIIIKMKLNEIERIRRMNRPTDQKGIPFLD